jgi:hypothetical protein
MQSNMKEIKRTKISNFLYTTFKLSENVVNALFDAKADKGEKVVTSVS